MTEAEEADAGLPAGPGAPTPLSALQVRLAVGYLDECLILSLCN